MVSMKDAEDVREDIDQGVKWGSKGKAVTMQTKHVFILRSLLKTVSKCTRRKCTKPPRH